MSVNLDQHHDVAPMIHQLAARLTVRLFLVLAMRSTLKGYSRVATGTLSDARSRSAASTIVSLR